MTNHIFDQLTFHLEVAKSLLNKITPPSGTITFTVNNWGQTLTEIESCKDNVEIGYTCMEISTAIEALKTILSDLNCSPRPSLRANQNKRKHKQRKLTCYQL